MQRVLNEETLHGFEELVVPFVLCGAACSFKFAICV